MKRFSTWLLVLPALLLLTVSEATAQQRSGFGISIGTGGYATPGFGYSTGYGGGNGFGYGYPGGYGYGLGGWNNNFGYGNPYGYGYSPYGYGRGTGVNISLGSNNWNRYDNYGYNTGYSYPTYTTTSARPYPTYSYPTYSTASMPTTSSSFYQPATYSSNGLVPMSYTIPSTATESGVVQASAWSSPTMNQGIMTLGGTMMSSTPAVAKIKMKVPSGFELWIDGKKYDEPGEHQEFTSEMLTSITNVILKLKSGETTREFTVPVRPGENSTFDLAQLVR
jgi:hypothetical protein